VKLTSAGNLSFTSKTPETDINVVTWRKNGSPMYVATAMAVNRGEELFPHTNPRPPPYYMLMETTTSSPDMELVLGYLLRQTEVEVEKRIKDSTLLARIRVERGRAD